MTNRIPRIGDVIVWGSSEDHHLVPVWVKGFGPGPFLVTKTIDEDREFHVKPIGYSAADTDNFKKWNESRDYFVFDMEGMRVDEFLTAVHRAKHGKRRKLQRR